MPMKTTRRPKFISPKSEVVIKKPDSKKKWTVIYQNN